MSWENFWHGTLKRPYKLYVHDHGGDGPVVILLHGIAASSDDWQHLVKLLKHHYRCITIDLLGFGKSPKPQWYGYRLEDHLRAVQHTIRQLRLKEPFTLIGHSLGSLLATRYTRRYPRRVQHLILLSPPVYAPLDTITNKQARQRTALYLRIYQFLRLHPRVTEKNFERLKRLLPLPRTVINHKDQWVPFVRTLEQCIERQTIIEDIKTIKPPIDIFYGTLDGVVVPHNIRQLASLRDVTIHALPRVYHPVSRRYAAAVAGLLTSLTVQSEN